MKSNRNSACSLNYYRIMAKDLENLQIIWNREKTTMLEGKLSRKEKEFLEFATSIVNGAFDSAKLHLELLRRMVADDEEIFECVTVVAAFMKNTNFTTGLQLDVPQPEWFAGLAQK